MSVEKTNFNFDEEPPSYNSTNTSFKHETNNPIATYTVSKHGLIKFEYNITNNKQGNNYAIKVGLKKVKLIDNDKLACINHEYFEFMNTAWNIELNKGFEMFSNVKLYNRTFNKRPQYVLIFEKNDIYIEYTFIKQKSSSTVWELYQNNQLILQYTIHTFKKNTLVQYSHIEEVIFQIILLAMIFLTLDSQYRYHQSNERTQL